MISYKESMKSVCDECGCRVEFEEQAYGFVVIFYRNITTQATTQADALKEKDKMIIDILRKNPHISQSRIAEELSWKIDTVKYYIKKLRENGILRYDGTTQNGVWRIMEDNIIKD